MLLGATRAGKSSTGNTILGRDVFRVGFISTRTCAKQEAVVSGRTISIIDTPGLLESSFFMDRRKSEIEKSLQIAAPGPHVFLLVFNLLGFTDEEKNTVKWFQENLEKDALNHTIILFTQRNAQSMNSIRNQYADIQSLIDSCSGRYHSFNNNDRHNRGQVTKLLARIDELVLRNGGVHYTKQNIFKRQDDTDGCEIQ